MSAVYCAFDVFLSVCFYLWILFSLRDNGMHLISPTANDKAEQHRKNVDAMKLKI